MVRNTSAVVPQSRFTLEVAGSACRRRHDSRLIKNPRNKCSIVWKLIQNLDWRLTSCLEVCEVADIALERQFNSRLDSQKMAPAILAVWNADQHIVVHHPSY